MPELPDWDEGFADAEPVSPIEKARLSQERGDQREGMRPASGISHSGRNRFCCAFGANIEIVETEPDKRERTQVIASHECDRA